MSGARLASHRFAMKPVFACRMFLVAAFFGAAAPAAFAGGGSNQEALRKALVARIERAARALPEGHLRVKVEERREFRFRRAPKRLEGEVYRLVDPNALIFHYLPPADLGLVWTGGSARRVKPDGSSETLSETAGNLALLNALFGGAADAALDGWRVADLARDEGAAKFALRPVKKAYDKRFRRLELVFEGERLKRLEFVRANGVEHAYAFGRPETVDRGTAPARYREWVR